MHVLTLSPPLDLRPRWAGSYLAHTMAEYGMSLVTLGLAEELREAGIAANSLWPRTMIATAAVADPLTGRTPSAGPAPRRSWPTPRAVLVRDPRSCRARAGTSWVEGDLVVATSAGTALDAADVRRGFRRSAADAGLDARARTLGAAAQLRLAEPAARR